MVSVKDTSRPKKIAIVLNGCGHRDGSEIHEVVLTMLAIDQCGAEWEALALDMNQSVVLNHLDGAVDRDSSPRNMLKESARIARGRIKTLRDADPRLYDAVIIPGGNGTASNLCDFATSGKNMTVNPFLSDFLLKAHENKRPIGAICIAPILLASLFGGRGVKLALGEIAGPAALAAESMGAKIQPCDASHCVVDDDLRVVTTPAYMLEASLSEIGSGIGKMVKEVVKLSHG